MDEFIILLPVRCYTCGFVLGKFQEKYEYLVETGTLSMENIIKMFNPEYKGSLSDTEIEYEKDIRSIFFKIDRTRDCCLTNLLSPIVLPDTRKPVYPDPSNRERMITSMSIDRETPGYERPVTRFYTKTFSDVSNKRKLPKREEMGIIDFPDKDDEDKMDVDKPTVDITQGIATISSSIPISIPSSPPKPVVPVSKIGPPTKIIPAYSGIKQLSSSTLTMRSPPPLGSIRSTSVPVIPVIPKTVQLDLSGLVKK